MNRPIISFLSNLDLSPILVTAEYTSLRWENKSAGAGEFEIHFGKNISVPCGCVVKISAEVTEAYGVSLYITKKEHETVVIGKMLSCIFSWRYPSIDGSSLTYSTNNGACYLVCSAARYGCVDPENYFFGKPVTYSYEAEDSSLSFSASLSESCLSTMSTIANDAKKTFFVTVSDGAVNVSAQNYRDCGITLIGGGGQMSEESYTYSVDNERNVFGYSIKSGEGYIYQKYPTLNPPEGCDRRVLYIGRFDEVPGFELKKAKANRRVSDSFEAKINPSLRHSLFPGGRVKIEKPEWDLNQEFNITSVTDIWEDAYSCRVVFGDAQPGAYEKIIERL